jgi:hypothetical protein
MELFVWCVFFSLKFLLKTVQLPEVKSSFMQKPKPPKEEAFVKKHKHVMEMLCSHAILMEVQ